MSFWAVKQKEQQEESQDLQNSKRLTDATKEQVPFAHLSTRICSKNALNSAK